MSVTLSEHSDSVYQLTGDVSPKKASFLDSLLGKASKAEKSTQSSSSWTNIFSKKTSPSSVPVPEQVDSKTAALIEELRNEGRTQADIDFQLSFIHDMSKTPAPAPTPPKRSPNVFTQFFREIQQAFKEEIYDDAYPVYEDDVRRLTVSISAGPFMGAPPPNTHLSYEELAMIEPLYMGTSSCINNLPSCKHDGTPLPGDQTNCPICLGEFCQGEDLKSLPCVHFYHKGCIDSWLMVGHACPVCKLLVV